MTNPILRRAAVLTLPSEDSEGGERIRYVLVTDDGLAGPAPVVSATTAVEAVEIDFAMPEWAGLEGYGVCQIIGGGAYPLAHGVNTLPLTALLQDRTLAAFFAVNEEGRAGPAVLRWLYAESFESEVETPVVVQPLTLSGDPVVTTSGVVGAAVSVVWPVPSRAGSSETRVLRVWSAQTGGSLLATVPVSSSSITVPDYVDGWIEAAYSILDTALNVSVAAASARIQVLSSLDPSFIAAGDVTWASEWLSGNMTFRADVTVAGVGRSDQLQWRMSVPGRFETGWADCTLPEASPSTKRRLGSILRPSAEPGAGFDITEFCNNDERFFVYLRKKVGVGAWSAASARLIAPPPGSFVPTVTVATRAALKGAVDAAWSNPDLVVIALSADIDYGGNTSTQLQWVNRAKVGKPIIITSVDRASPRAIKKLQGTAFGFNGCENVIIDCVGLDNDETEEMGGPTTENGVSVTYGPVRIPTGCFLKAEGGRRIHVRDVRLRGARNCIQLNESVDCGVFNFEMWEVSEDGIRFLTHATRPKVVGGHFRNWYAYGHWGEPSQNPASHFDAIQFSVSGNDAAEAIGIIQPLVLNCFIFGWDGYMQGIQVGTNRPGLWIKGLTIQNVYQEVSKPNGFPFRSCVGWALENCVAREIEGQTNASAAGNLRVTAPVAAGVVRNVIVSKRNDIEANGVAQSKTAIAASYERTGLQEDQPRTAFPATWGTVGEGRDRRRRYPHGADNYRGDWVPPAVPAPPTRTQATLAASISRGATLNLAGYFTGSEIVFSSNTGTGRRHLWVNPKTGILHTFGYTTRKAYSIAVRAQNAGGYVELTLNLTVT